MTTETSSAAFSVRDFRQALSSFATGVTIVTAVDQAGEPVGMTASSFNSVSLDPPLILWSVTKSAYSAEAFKAAGHFAVHVLASDQITLSNRFAKSGNDKFGDTDYSRDKNGIPILAGAACRFDCAGWAVYEGGDHWIIVGRVLAIEHANLESLVFCSGSYATANPVRMMSETGSSGGGGDGAIDGLLFYNLSRAYHQMASEFHQAVRDSGLGLSQWRILASLHGRLTRDLPELAARTFVDPEALPDLIQSLAEQGLCLVEGAPDSVRVTGTDAGHDRVDHLMRLGAELEKKAIGAGGQQQLDDLISTLKTVINNTG